MDPVFLGMDAYEIAYSVACIVLLGVLLWRNGHLVLTVSLWVPAMSHLYHLLFGEGSYADGDPWYDSYEIAVFAEVVILRGITTIFVKSGWFFSAVGLSLAAILPFGGGGRVYDGLALGFDALLLFAVSAHDGLAQRGAE